MLRLALLVALLLPAPCLAGLHYSGETFAPLPCQWRGLLLDQRTLRQVAAKKGPLATRYVREAGRLAAKGTLSADEAADLGALHLRLGDADRAVEVLRPAQAANPKHFRLAANLGTAWQQQGRLTQAAAALERAVRLAPAALAPAERLHLRLVRSRLRDKPGASSLDDLIGVRFAAPGALATAGRKLLTAEVIGQLQLLALWLPGDGRLLWQLAEVAGAGGDTAVAAAMMDGCIAEFNLRNADLLARRKQYRVAPKQGHDEHTALFKPKSPRALVQRHAVLPAVNATGVNALPWESIGETTVDRHARPTFGQHMRQLDDKRVTLAGYMQPLGEEGGDAVAFLLVEHPVGCWYCEVPELAHIVLIEMPDGGACRLRRGRVRIAGKLSLNAKDPENFLYTIRDAKVGDEAE